MAYSWAVISFATVILSYLLFRKRTSTRAPLPPGPKGLPLLGNLNDLPQPGVLEAHHWLKHKDLYGMFEQCSCCWPASNVDKRTKFDRMVM